MIFIALVLGFIGHKIIGWSIKKRNDLSKKTTHEFCVSSENLEKYIEYYHSVEHTLQYTVPTELSALDADTIMQDPAYQRLLREHREGYISFLEAHSFCIHKEALIPLLGEINDDEKLSQRILRLIFLSKTPKA